MEGKAGSVSVSLSQLSIKILRGSPFVLGLFKSYQPQGYRGLSPPIQILLVFLEEKWLHNHMQLFTSAKPWVQVCLLDETTGYVCCRILVFIFSLQGYPVVRPWFMSGQRRRFCHNRFFTGSEYFYGQKSGEQK